MKKKLLTLVLALTMMLSMSMTAMADEKAATAPAGEFTIYKDYAVNAVDGEGSVFPKETLSFTSTASTSNPDGGTANLAINPVAMSKVTDNEITVSYPALPGLGVYEFKISETAGNTQGVSYDPNSITVKIVVTNDDSSPTHLYKAEVISGLNYSKDDTFDNTYNLGSLDVTKVVAGDLGDKTAEFPVTVTFTKTSDVLSDITYTDNNTGEGNASVTDGVVTFTGNEATVQIYLKNGETVTFKNIPAGVTYSVTETNTYGHTETYENQNGTISSKTKSTATITNTKNADVDTGIIVNNLPYILVLAGVVIAAVVLFRRKRYSAM